MFQVLKNQRILQLILFCIRLRARAVKDRYFSPTQALFGRTDLVYIITFAGITRLRHCNAMSVELVDLDRNSPQSVQSNMDTYKQQSWNIRPRNGCPRLRGAVTLLSGMAHVGEHLLCSRFPIRCASVTSPYHSIPEDNLGAVLVSSEPFDLSSAQKAAN